MEKKKRKKERKGKEEIDRNGRREVEGRISIKEKHFRAFKFLFKNIVSFYFNFLFIFLSSNFCFVLQVILYGIKNSKNL